MITFKDWLMQNYPNTIPSSERIIDLQAGWIGAMESMRDETGERFIFPVTQEHKEVALKMANTRPGEIIFMTEDQMKLLSDVERF